jgi:MoaA/NifB/PqqE/SkfB family radical SAM enzyme
MSTAQAKELIGNLQKLGTKKLGFTGGEPLVRKDIFELVEYAKSRGMITHLVTNASLLDESNVGRLKAVDVLFISWEGPRDVNEGIRSKSSVDVLDRIRLAKQHGVKVCVLATLVRQNLKHLPYILEKSDELGFPVLFSLLHYHNYSAKDMRALEAEENDISRALDYLIGMKRKGFMVANSYSYLRFARNWRKGMPKCYAGKLYAVIDANGDVYPCWPAVGALAPLNVFKDGFAQAIKGTSRHKCNGCNFSCHHELNFLLSLHLNAVRNILNNYM